MNPLQKIAMISCRQAAVLGAKASFNALSLVEKMKLRIHAKMCTTCRDYQKDSALIDQAIDKIIRQKEQQGHTLSPTQRDKILEAIR